MSATKQMGVFQQPAVCSEAAGREKGRQVKKAR